VDPGAVRRRDIALGADNKAIFVFGLQLVQDTGDFVGSEFFCSLRAPRLEYLVGIVFAVVMVMMVVVMRMMTMMSVVVGVV